MTISDFFTNNCRTIPAIAAGSSLVRNMLEIALLNANVQSDEDYLSLAELCRKFQISNLIEHIFLRYVILHQIEPPSDIPSQGFGDSNTRQVVSEDPECF
jgi:hypothetical protein